MRILHLTHDTADPTTYKRVRMLEAGGATVTVAGFRRSAQPLTHIESAPVIDFGRTHPARFLHRIVSVLRTVISIHKHRELFAQTDIVIARNLEMLAIAARGISNTTPKPTLVYECLDIHRLMLRRDFIGRALRTLEGNLTRQASLLLTSSPAFISQYFNALSQVKLPIQLLENKVLRLGDDITPTEKPARQAPWRIGWFGIIRCRKSFEALCALAIEHPNLVEIHIRGRIAHDQLPDLETRIKTIPAITYHGPYHANEIGTHYNEVDFAWAIDLFEEGQNSKWLLPNRLYDSCYYGAVPLALANVETAAMLTRHHIGQVLSDITPATLASFFSTLTADSYRTLRSAVLASPRALWRDTTNDCKALVASFAQLRPILSPAHAPSTASPALVVVPTLNEANHLPALLDYLITESATLPMTIIIADGGSTDGTTDLITLAAQSHPNIHYLHNPKRIQSAAINLAVAQYGQASELLIRLDAHAYYPIGYCRTLIEEALTTHADAVVVSMHTRGHSLFQSAVALAQNSKLGNGGASHRLSTHQGKWVEHGHHALMRITAFRTIGGYDETFTHNEDAELDIRLRSAGYRHWLTTKTGLDYIPRATPLSLFRQYINYGRGRARTTLKHQQFPKLRQLLPLLVAPAFLLLLATPLTPLALLPLLCWLLACTAYGTYLAIRTHRAANTLSAPAAMIMHSAWSLGFWQELLLHRKRYA